MWPVFETTLKRFRELESGLSDPATAADPVKYSRLAKEHGQLGKQIRPYLDYLQVREQIQQAEQMVQGDDADLRELAEAELLELRPREAELTARLEDLLLVEPGEDFERLIVEIRAGTGGDEAALFAGDLYEMYTRFARTRGWTVEEMNFSPGEAGGFKEVVFGIRGEGAYRELRYESGGHRVQRVPKTETQGRIHTSAATVAIMPEPDEAQIDVNPNEIEIETMRAGGAGGQHVNKTESAVRLWYRRGTPDELEVKCQDERSQHKNRERAMRVLRSRIFERNQQRAHQLRADHRKSLIGSGDRSDRIRTYNFPQNRLTDHRINLTLYRLDAIVGGELDEVIQGLKAYEKKQKLSGAGAAP
jgi:peptide chain release factor 1